MGCAEPSGNRDAKQDRRDAGGGRDFWGAGGISFVRFGFAPRATSSTRAVSLIRHCHCSYTRYLYFSQSHFPRAHSVRHWPLPLLDSADSTCSRPSCLNLAVSLLVSCVLPRLGASLHLSLLRSTLVPRRPIITPLLARCTIDHTARPGCPASAHRRTHVRFVVARSLLFAALLLLVLLRVRLVRGIFVGIEDKVRASALLLAVL